MTKHNIYIKQLNKNFKEQLNMEYSQINTEYSRLYS